MPPRKRTSDDATPAKKIAAEKALAKKVRAKKTIAKKAPTKSVVGLEDTAPVVESPQGDDLTTDDDAVSDPIATHPDGESTSTVLENETTSDNKNSDKIIDDERVIKSRETTTTRRIVEHEPGHTEEETVTVIVERTERIPLPYAGPISTHPAPVG